jgi:hypothetical protein
VVAYCTGCGTELGADWRVCRQCGQQVTPLPTSPRGVFAGRHRNLAILGLTLLGLLLLGSLMAVAINAPTPTSVRPARTPQPTDTPAPTRNQSRLACEHWRNVMRDVRDGVLTDAELRAKLKEVDGSTAIATVQVQEAARRMLAAVTQGDAEAFAAAVSEMDAACTASGV